MFYIAVSISDLNRPYDENSTSLAIKDRKKKAKTDRDRQTIVKFVKDIRACLSFKFVFAVVCL